MNKRGLYTGGHGCILMVEAIIISCSRVRRYDIAIHINNSGLVFVTIKVLSV